MFLWNFFIVAESEADQNDDAQSVRECDTSETAETKSVCKIYMKKADKNEKDDNEYVAYEPTQEERIGLSS